MQQTGSIRRSRSSLSHRSGCTQKAEEYQDHTEKFADVQHARNLQAAEETAERGHDCGEFLGSDEG